MENVLKYPSGDDSKQKFGKSVIAFALFLYNTLFSGTSEKPLLKILRFA